MTPLPKHLQVLRDELAVKSTSYDFNSPNEVKVKHEHLNALEVKHFKEGFNSAASLMLEDLESMAKALESRDCDYSILMLNGVIKSQKHEPTCKKCEALKNYRQKYEVKK